MLKKSLIEGIAIIAMAVFVVFTGCEGPAGPEGTQGETTVGSVDVNINQPETAAPWPEGVTYPDGTAKVLAGNAADIALAFNGGILVAETSDAGGGRTDQDKGTVYAQEPVDAVIWTGPGFNPTANLGSLSVPPGKTLYINGPLVIGDDVGQFSAVSISDEGTYPAASQVQLSLQGGSPVNGNDKGKIVVLAGGSIKDDNTSGNNVGGTLTNGGVLELHRGSTVSFLVNKGTLNAVAGSETLVYGALWLGTQSNTLNGFLDIKAGGGVILGNLAGVSPTIVGPVKVDGLLQIQTSVILANTVDVGTTGVLDFDVNVTLANVVTLNGTLDAGGITVNLSGAASHLKVAEGGKIIATTGWNQFVYNGGSGATDVVLLAALAGESPTAENFHITIEAGAGSLDLNNITATSYANLVKLAGSTTLHLKAGNTILYGGNSGDEKLVITKGHSVVWSTATIIGDVTVESGGGLELTAAVTKAGNITVIDDGTAAGIGNGFVADSATFSAGFKSLTIGDEAGTKTSVSLPAFIGGWSTGDAVVTVYKGSTLKLWPDVFTSFPGTIDLKEGDTGKANGGILRFADTSNASTGVTFATLKELSVGAEAKFIAYDDTTNTTIGEAEQKLTGITFKDLTKLEVNGTVDVRDSTGITFAALQTKVGAQNDVKGTGTIRLDAWTVNNIVGAHTHAFDQILGIKDVTVDTVTGISSTSGSGTTPDAAPAADGILRVTTITAPSGGLTVNRKLYVDSSISFGSNGNTITLAAGAEVYAKKVLALGGPAQTAQGVLTAGGITTLDADAGVFAIGTSALTLTSGTVQIPGKLVISVGGLTVGNTILAVNANTSLFKAAVSIEGIAGTVTVNAGGVLSLGAAVALGTGSKIEVAEKGSIITTSAGSLTIATGTVLSANSTLTATASESSLVNESTTTPTTANIATINGAFTLTATSASASTLTFGANSTQFLNIPGALSVINGTSEYDKATLAGTEIIGTTGNLLFTATSSGGGQISFPNSITIKGGTLTTTGSGALVFGTIATLRAGPDPLALPAILTGAGIQEGTLTLKSGSVLALLSGVFAVGSATTPAVAELDVGQGRVTFNSGNALNIYGNATSGSTLLGSFKFGSVIISGTAAGTSLADAIGNSSYDYANTTTPPTSTDLAGAIETPGTTVPAPNAASVVWASNNVTITASGTNTITSASKLYSTTQQATPAP
jgi:hypothetical protein